MSQALLQHMRSLTHRFQLCGDVPEEGRGGLDGRGGDAAHSQHQIALHKYRGYVYR